MFTKLMQAMGAFYLMNQYISYLFKAKGLHGLHSPFVFELAKNVLDDRQKYPEYELLLKQRKHLLSNRNLIETVDFGAKAGSKEFTTYRERVKNLVKQRSHSVRGNQLLFRLSKYFKPQFVLEFGTAAGMGAAAIALGNPDAKLITLEGCASIASVASGSFERLKITNAEIIIGNFNTVLAEVIDRIPKLDMVFFDGNHQKIPTLDYFHHCLTKAHEDSVFIFDDIHWSEGMNEAWKEIQQHEDVRVTIDLFQFGLVFFNKGLSKQHFTLKS
ncbi:MAG: class I SAM-dependent methyltransferase [Bacteroidales bacterium]|nr:class I SAM-dependent methyltransferase [Bacteroidales bacterium]